jgi:hypothetical protein
MLREPMLQSEDGKAHPDTGRLQPASASQTSRFWERCLNPFALVNLGSA